MPRTIVDKVVEHLSGFMSPDRLSDFSPDEQACISSKVKKLMGEGKPQDQAVAIAISTCAPEKSKKQSMSFSKANVEDMPDYDDLGGRYSAKQNKNGTWNIYNVEIFAEVPKDERGNDEKIGKEWMLRAIKRADMRHRENGYYAPVHVRHHDMGTTNDYAGKLALKYVAPITYEGREIYALFADIVEIPDDVFGEIEQGKLAYRSVEIKDYDNPEIHSLALLPDEVPYFRVRMLSVGTKAKANFKTRTELVDMYGERTPLQGFCYDGQMAAYLFRNDWVKGGITMTFKEWLEKHGLSKFSLSSAWKSIFKKKFEHGEEPDEDEKKKLMGGEEPDEDDKKKLEDEKNPDEKEGQLDDGDAIRATIAEALAPIVEDIKSIKEKIGMADDDDDDDDNDNGPASGGEEQPAEMKAFREKMAKQDAEIYALKKKEAKREKEAKFSSMVEKAIRTDLAGREIDEELKSNLFKMAQGGDDVFKVYVDTLKDRLSTDGPRDEYGIDEALTRFNDEENETLASFKTLGADVYEAAMRHTQTYAALKSVGHAKCSLGEHIANQLRAEGGHDMKKISKLVKSK